MLQKKGACNVKNEKQIEILKNNNAEINAITKEAIEQALIFLLNEKSFKDITITEIAKKAGVSRTAYYRNYKSKEDILSTCLKTIMTNTSNALLEYNVLENAKETWVALLQKVKENYKEYKLLLSAGYKNIIIDEFNKSMNDNISKKQFELYYSNLYWAGAISSVVLEWIEDDMNISIEQVAELGSNLMINGLNTFKEYGNKCVEK